MVENSCTKTNFILCNLLVSVIFLGMPLDLTGITGAQVFLAILEAASEDFCRRSALKRADFGFFLIVKCFKGSGL